MNKADVQPADGRTPEHVTVAETVIQRNSYYYWLSAIVDPDSDEQLHVRLLPMRIQMAAELLLPELKQKHDVDASSMNDLEREEPSQPDGTYRMSSSRKPSRP